MGLSRQSEHGCAHATLSMRKARHLVALATLLSTSLFAASDCLPIADAKQHVGETKCITGKVLRVKVGDKGVHFVDFCEDQAACPFVVVIFPSDLKDVGDVRRLAGHVIEIGRMRPTKKPKKTKAKPAATATFGKEADAGDEPSQ